MRNSIKGYTPLGQLGILLAFFGGGFVLAAVAQLVIAMWMLPKGVNITNLQEELMKALKDPSQVTMMQLMQVLGTVFLMLLPSWFYARVTWGKDPIWLGFSKHFNVMQIVIGFGIILMANVVAQPLADLSKSIINHFPGLHQMAQGMEDTYNEQIKAMSNLRGWGDYLLALFIMAFCAAMFEEIFFRGALQNVLIRWLRSPLAGIVLASLLFTLVHLSIFLFLSRFVLGIVLGLLYYKSKNIWVNIIAHFLNNAIAVTQMFFLSQKGKAVKVEDLDPKIPWWGGLIAFAILVWLFIIFEKVSADKRARITAKEQLLYANADPFAGFAKTDNNGAE